MNAALSAVLKPQLFGTDIVRNRCYSGKPTFLRRAFTRGSPRSRANSGSLSALPIRKGPRTAERSSASKVRAPCRRDRQRSGLVGTVLAKDRLQVSQPRFARNLRTKSQLRRMALAFRRRQFY